jgi:AcrR family transcriptional regulator
LRSSAEVPDGQPTPVDGVETRHGKDRTLDRILDAAERDFMAHGLYGSTIHSIAFGAGVSRQILYRYYDTKEKLYVAVLDKLNRKFADVLFNYNYDKLPPAEAIRAYMRHVFDICYKHHAVLGLDVWRSENIPKLSKELTRTATECIAKILARGRREALFRSDIEASRFFCYALALTMGIVCSSRTMTLLTGSDFDSAQAMAAWRDFCAESGLRLLSKAQ